jgi:hypothetical protein
LPRIDHAHLAEVAPAPTRAPRAGALSVLVIEDAPRDREWLVKTLEGAGYGVESAATGAEALRFLNQRPFDAITLDLMLPDMSGWDVLRQARAGEINRTVPVVVVKCWLTKGPESVSRFTTSWKNRWRRVICSRPWIEPGCRARPRVRPFCWWTITAVS